MIIRIKLQNKMSFIEKLKICINESKYFEWYENNGFKIINCDSGEFIDDISDKYKVTKSKKKASFYRQLHFYEFKLKEKKTNKKGDILVKEDIFIHKNIIFNKFYNFNSDPIKRYSGRKRKREKKFKNFNDDEMVNDINDIFDLKSLVNKNVNFDYFFENYNESEYIIENKLPKLIVY